MPDDLGYARRPHRPTLGDLNGCLRTFFLKPTVPWHNQFKATLEMHGNAMTLYSDSILNIKSAVVEMAGIPIPHFASPPPHWAEFQNKLNEAKAAAKSWANEVYAAVQDVPVQISNGSLVSDDITATIEALSALQDTPQDANKLETLEAALRKLTADMASIKTYADKSMACIKSASAADMPVIAGDLASIYTRSAADAAADEQILAQLDSQMETLRSEIEAEDKKIIVEAAEVAVSAVLVLMIPPLRIASIATVIFLSTFLALDIRRLLDLEQQIETLAVEANQITLQIGQLSQINRTFQRYAQRCGPLSTDVFNLSDGLTNLLRVVADIENGEQNAFAIIDMLRQGSGNDAANLKGMSETLTSIQSEWASCSDFVTAMSIDFTVNLGSFSIGMSAADVETTAKGSASMDILQFVNAGAA